MDAAASGSSFACCICTALRWLGWGWGWKLQEHSPVPSNIHPKGLGSSCMVAGIFFRCMNPSAIPSSHDFLSFPFDRVDLGVGDWGVA